MKPETKSRMKTKKPKTRNPTEKELLDFALWCAHSRTLGESVFDWGRFGRIVEGKARDLIKQKCVECGK